MEYRILNGKRIIIASPEDDILTPEDIDMDIRAREAVKAAIHRAEICKKPIAKYDIAAKKSYIEYPDGTRKYAE